MSVTIKNNFNAYKQDFTKDTKLDADKNMALYISYVIARTSDYNFQVNSTIFNELGHIPRYIGNSIKDALKKP